MAAIRNPDKNRKSIRLKGHDYSKSNAFFVTICIKDSKIKPGEINDDKFLPNDYGLSVEESWHWLESHFDYVELDEYIIMPNHLHGVILVTDIRRGGSRAAPTAKMPKTKPLGQLIGAFKTVSTKIINRMRNSSGVQIWQRNYFERIIRNEKELVKIREYISKNPVQWNIDKENPKDINCDSSP